MKPNCLSKVALLSLSCAAMFASVPATAQPDTNGARVIKPSGMVVFSDSLADSGNTFDLLNTLDGHGDSDYLIYPLLSAGETVWGRFVNYGVRYLGKFLVKTVSSMGFLPVIPQQPYWHHHFSDGKVWNEYLADRMGLVEHSVKDMETDTYKAEHPRAYIDVTGEHINRAFGGSWSTMTLKKFNWLHPIDSTIALIKGKLVPPSLGLIEKAYIKEMKNMYPDSNPKLDGDALYAVLYGGNDYLNVETFIDLEKLSQGDSHELQEMHGYVNHVINSIEASIDELSANGANQFLLTNMPDFTLAPRYLELEKIRGGLRQTLEYHNQQLDKLHQKLTNEGLKVAYFDLHRAFPVVRDELAAKGVNISQACLLNDIVGMREGKEPAPDYFEGNFILNEVIKRQHYLANHPAVLESMANRVCETTGKPYEQHMFWDKVHPTTVAHKQIADAVCSNEYNKGYEINCLA